MDIRTDWLWTVSLVRIALVAETFTPAVNGVVNSVRQVADNLARRGHEPIVVAPSGADYRSASGHRIEVVNVPSMSMPGYRQLDVAWPSVDLLPTLERLQPDVVHLASPAVLGASAVKATTQLDIPTVAIYQTDLPAYAKRYHFGISQRLVWSYLRRIHNSTDLTLVPSSASMYQLAGQGIGPLARWARGVDNKLFNPIHRDDLLHRQLGGGQLLVGIVGRLAPEKRVHLLDATSELPGVQVVVVGDGPKRRSLERQLPDAKFTGQLVGGDLGRVMASLDVLVHAGADETFCQVIQEALCAGVPVITTASGGPLDLVLNGQNGLLWAGDDPDVLAAQVAVLRDDPITRARLAASARPSVVHRTWANVTDELIGHYATVIASRRLSLRKAS